MAEYLSRINFQTTYHLGKKNTTSDGLTRQSRDLLSEGDEQYQNVSMVIKPHNIIRLLADSPPSQGRKLFEILWKEGIASDSWPTHVLQMLREKTRHCKKISLPDYSEREGRLLYQDSVVVPNYP